MLINFLEESNLELFILEIDCKQYSLSILNKSLTNKTGKLYFTKFFDHSHSSIIGIEPQAIDSTIL